MARSTSFTFYRDVNLSSKNTDTFYFADRTAQTTYFNSKAVTTVSNCYYQRSNKGKLKVQRSYSTLYKCDYLSFINPDYENKRFYAFITGVNYIDDSTTEIEYIIDDVQTWLLDCTIPACYVERCHSSSDEIGDNMLPDSYELGEYVLNEFTWRNNSVRVADGISTRTLVIFQATFDFGVWCSSGFVTKQAPALFIKQGIYDNVSQYAVYSEDFGAGSHADTGSALQMILSAIYNGLGGVTIQDIVNIYIYPSIAILLDTANPISIGSQGGIYDNVYAVGGAGFDEVLLPSYPSTLDGYTPRNKKMLQYPFTLLHVVNNDGSAIDLKFERFRESATYEIPTQLKALISGCSTGEAKIRFTPKQYLGEGSNYDYDLSLDSGSFPTVSMIGDQYLIYLAQNKNRIKNNYDMMLFNSANNIMTGAISDMHTVSELYAGGEAGALSGAGNMRNSQSYEAFKSTGASMINQISNLHAQFKDMQIAPATCSGISGVGLAFQNGKRDFSISIKSIDRYHAKMIDDYFTMFGYPCRLVRTINLHCRNSFTYIKTIGCIIRGAVPETAKNNIENLFDSGIRFWSNYANIGDFSVNNDVLTP